MIWARKDDKLYALHNLTVYGQFIYTWFSCCFAFITLHVVKVIGKYISSCSELYSSIGVLKI